MASSQTTQGAGAAAGIEAAAGPGTAVPAAASGRIVATYLLETPFEPERVAGIMAGEQSSGTFVRVQGETDELRARTAAAVESVQELEPAAAASLPNAWLQRRGVAGPWRRARVALSFPVDNVGANLPTLAATVAGNLYDLGETTGLRLERLDLPAAYRARFELPRHGVAGTRWLLGVPQRALIGTIIKPNLGLSPQQTAELAGQLCEAGIDFIKDDEVCADPACAPIARRVPAVMERVRRYRDRTGRTVMVAFNITDDLDAMRRHAELIEREQGCCAMVSLNWCGFSAVQALRRSTGLAIHGHRNGYGMFARHPALGMSFQAYQALWRLAGVDHMHVHGLQGKFADFDEDVVAAARDCLSPMGGGDAVLPAFSNAQWAGTVPATYRAVGSQDLLFMSGGGILAHPDGAAAGVASLRQAWDATARGVALQDAARDAPELARALAFYGRPAP